MSSQLESLRLSIKNVSQATYMSILKDNLQKLKNTDQLSYTEMSNLFEFFRPLVQRDEYSQNFNFICNQPNYRAEGQEVAQSVDQILDKNHHALIEIRKVINRVQRLYLDFNNLPGPQDGLPGADSSAKQKEIDQMQ